MILEPEARATSGPHSLSLFSSSQRECVLALILDVIFFLLRGTFCVAYRIADAYLLCRSATAALTEPAKQQFIIDCLDLGEFVKLEDVLVF